MLAPKKVEAQDGSVASSASSGRLARLERTWGTYVCRPASGKLERTCTAYGSSASTRLVQPYHERG